MAEEEKASSIKKEIVKNETTSNITSKTEVNTNNDSIVSTNKRKKTSSVSWESDDKIETKDIQLNDESILNDNNNNLKNKDEHVRSNNFIKKTSNDFNKPKVNSIKFNSSNDFMNGYQKSEIVSPKNFRTNSRTCKFNDIDDEDNINWPNYYDKHELNQVASRFVQQIIEDATKEVEKRLKPSTSSSKGSLFFFFNFH